MKVQELKTGTGGWSILAFATGLFVLIYSIFRAEHLSMTHDEAVSYLHHIYRGLSYWDIMSYSVPTVNNHLLNTLLMKFFCGIWGDSELVIRTPALIGCVIYLTGIFYVLNSFLRGKFLFLAFAVSVLNPFLIDYFSCARGYSLGIGFLAWGLFFFEKRTVEDGTKPFSRSLYAALACLMLSLSVMSNLAFLHVYLTGIVIAGIIEALEFFFRDRREKRFSPEMLRRIALWFIQIFPSAIILLAVYAKPIQKLMKVQDFYYGGNNGFFADTVSSLFVAIFYSGSYDGSVIESFFTQVGKSGVIASVGLAAVFVMRRLFVKDVNRWDKIMLLFFGFSVICSFIIIFQKWTIGSLYVIDRGAIFFIPVFACFLFALAKSVTERCAQGSKSFFRNILIVPAIIFLAHCVLRMNLTHYRMMIPDADTRQMMRDIGDLTRDKSGQIGTVKLGVQWISEPSVNYYLLKNKMRWIDFVDRKGLDDKFDYYYLFFDDKHHSYDDRYMVDKYRLKLLKRYAMYNTYLATAQ